MIRSARSERKSLSEVAGHKLSQAKTGGTYRSGSQLPTKGELCEMPGVSRTVTREALRILEENALVPGRGPTGLRVPSVEDSQ